MNKNEKFVITINRELGSGGRTVGRKLAERLNVPFFDKALIKSLEEKYNLTVEEIEKLKGRQQGFWVDLKRVIRLGDGWVLANDKVYQTTPSDASEKLTTEDVFKVEVEILKGIAEAGSCVVAGRSGFFIFRNHPNHLSVFIQASMDYRVERVASKQNLTKEEARKVIERVDKMRENYVNRYTATSRYDTRNYDVVLRSDGMTEDELVDIIMKYVTEG